MSDPLSVAAGVIGILTAAAQISTLLIQFTKSSRGAPAQARHVLSEVHDISGTLSHLQSFLLGNEHIDRSRASLLKIDHIVTIMSDCVIAFSELKKFLDGLKTNDMDILDGMKWARKEAEITAIIERLQHHKASLSLMLSILTSNTIEEAKRAVDRMHTNVHMYYQEMSARLHALELRNAQQSGYPISMQEDVNSACNPSYIAELRPGSAAELVSALECDSKDHDYTKDLSQSWVYSRNAAFRMSTFSLDHYSTTWSCLSALSLSDVSNISVINLVITVEEVDNPQRLSQTGSNARNLRLSETPAPEVNWRLERPSIPDNISSPSAHQDARSAREHRCTSSDSSSNNASPTDPSLQWPINRVLMWLTDNGFSNAWRETFKILNIQGDDFLELSRKTSERDSFRFTMMYQLVYPRLARECSLNGTGWDQTRERNEGRRLRRLIRGLIDGTEAPSSSAASHNHAETSSMRTIKGPSEPTNRRSLTNKLSTPVDSAWTDARELVSEASPRETIEEINGTTYACHSCHKTIPEGKAFAFNDNLWHLDCFSCNICSTLLYRDATLTLLEDGSLICDNCTYSSSKCDVTIEDLAIFTRDDDDKASCAIRFICRNCKEQIHDLKYSQTSQGILCMGCHEDLVRRMAKKKISANGNDNEQGTKGERRGS